MIMKTYTNCKQFCNEKEKENDNYKSINKYY